MTALSGKISSFEKEFRRQKKIDPSLTFSKFYGAIVLEGVREGKDASTIGGYAVDGDAWRKGGKSTFLRYRDLGGASERARVIDYGCGTLRVGLHWMKYLDAGAYFGLDVMPEYLEIGSRVGGELIDKKKPKFGVIGDPEAESAAIAFDADLVFAEAVATLVHPDEMKVFGANLQAMASRPGSTVIFNANLKKRTVRYAKHGWTHPLGYFERMMPELDFVQLHFARDVEKNGETMTAAHLEFRRAG